ncbi:putative transcription factor TGA like domain-containing protein [Helianthus anomalus]
MDNLYVGIVAIEIMYDLWVFEQRKRDNELKIMLQNQVSELDLRISVDSSLNHYYDLFQMKANAMKANVFYFMYGMWRTPIKRIFQWLGGPRPSELICVRCGYLLILTIVNICPKWWYICLNILLCMLL